MKAPVMRDPQWVQEAIALLESAAAATPGTFRLALSGGETPRPLFRRLRRAALPWERTEVFWCDERDVPLSSRRSNAGEAMRLLLDFVPARCRPQHDPKAYEAMLRRRPEPLFHVALLGVGDDGHIASLFPGGPETRERRHWVVRSKAPDGEPRLTLTLPALRRAAERVFLAPELSPLARRLGKVIHLKTGSRAVRPPKTPPL